MQPKQPATHVLKVVHQRSSVVVKLKSSRPIAPRPGVEGYEVPGRGKMGESCGCPIPKFSCN